ncbi:MAG: hypothetical protein ABEJ79_01810 [Halolamina sp.]
MPVVVVPASPPRPGLVGTALVESSPLTEAEVAELHGAMLKDTVAAVDRAGADLLVNVRSDDDLPDEHVTDTDAGAELRAAVATAVNDVSDVRFEPQVGSSRSAVVGNAVTHLLREEGATSVGVAVPTAPLVTRSTLDSAGMKQRSSAVVLGPGGDGRVYYAGFAEPVDFAEAFAPPALRTLTERAPATVDGDATDVDFLPRQQVVDTGADLASLLTVLDARVAAGRAVPEHTTTTVREFGLDVVAEDDSIALRR